MDCGLWTLRTRVLDLGQQQLLSNPPPFRHSFLTSHHPLLCFPRAATHSNLAHSITPPTPPTIPTPPHPQPSELLAELQGRLPIRVTLKGLSEDDLYRILTEPITNLIKHQIELLKSEEVTLSFTEPAIREIARVAFETNRTVENIGARRLHTVIERIVEEISFDAPEKVRLSSLTQLLRQAVRPQAMCRA